MRNYVQRSLLQTFTLSSPDAPTYEPKSDRPVQFIDLFCGIGGASTGAVLAGYQVVYAADWWDEALRCHAHIHPESEHCRFEFPCDDDDITWPADPGAEFHLHGSPPCQQFSRVNTSGATETLKNGALLMIEWFLDLAIRKSPRRWSMEQVAHPLVIRVLEKWKRKHASLSFDFDVFQFEDLGLPQHRRRVIAGPSWLVNNLRRAIRRPSKVFDKTSEFRTPVGRVLPTMPPNAKYVRNSLVNYGDKRKIKRPIRKSMRRVTRLAFTVIGTNHRWYDRDMKLIRGFSVEELAILQSFPSWYTFEASVPLRVRQKGIANALPPYIMSLALGNRRPPPPPERLGECGACHADALNRDSDTDVEDFPH